MNRRVANLPRFLSRCPHRSRERANMPKAAASTSGKPNLRPQQRRGRQSSYPAAPRCLARYGVGVPGSVPWG